MKLNFTLTFLCHFIVPLSPISPCREFSEELWFVYCISLPNTSLRQIESRVTLLRASVFAFMGTYFFWNWDCKCMWDWYVESYMTMYQKKHQKKLWWKKLPSLRGSLPTMSLQIRNTFLWVNIVGKILKGWTAKLVNHLDLSTVKNSDSILISVPLRR